MRKLGLWIVCLFSLTLAACANQPMQEGVSAAAAPVPKVEGGQMPAAVPRGADPIYRYHLGASDKVRIITFDENALTGEFVVSGSGTISLPLIGDIKAQGLTTSELQEEIQNALRQGYLKDPKVNVEVMNYRPFYILGEVTKPGEYPFVNGLTVLNAVATANGFTYRADTRRVFIKRANENAEHEVDLTTTTPIEPGDTIRIKEKYF